MEIKMTQEAYDSLVKYQKEDTIFLLDEEDGRSEFSKAGSCSIDDLFFLVAISANKKSDFFKVKITTNKMPIYTTEGIAERLDEKMTLEIKSGLGYLHLKGTSGVLMEHLPVKDFQ